MSNVFFVGKGRITNTDFFDDTYGKRLYQKLPFFKKKVKIGAKYTLFSQSKQNNFTFQKSCCMYTFY